MFYSLDWKLESMLICGDFVGSENLGYFMGFWGVTILMVAILATGA
jgi:hypothetical protein